MDGHLMTNLLIAAATIESIAEVLLGLRTSEGKWNVKLTITLVIGVLVALIMPDFDAYKALGITVVPPIAGRLLTGIIASRGAKLFHDFLSIVEAYKINLKNDSALPR